MADFQIELKQTGDTHWCEEESWMKGWLRHHFFHSYYFSRMGGSVMGINTLLLDC